MEQRVHARAAFVVIEDMRVGTCGNAQGFPLLIEPADPLEEGRAGQGVDALLQFWSREKAWIDARLRRLGAILFRGFAITRQADFEYVMARLNSSLLNYVDGNSPRTRMAGGVYTSTEYPPEFFISLHNELSYSSRWPARLFFCCTLAAEGGGETALADSRVLLRSLPPEMVREFRSRQVRYVRNLHGGRGFGPSWQKTFETTDRAVVEAYAAGTGMQLDWHVDGSLRLTNIRPATMRHAITGEEVWFNQADQFHPSTHPAPIYKSMMELYKGREHELPQNATFADGGAIPPEYLETIRETTRRQLSLFRWQPGDLLMVDNILVAHGRMPFQGSRKVLVAMTAE